MSPIKPTADEIRIVASEPRVMAETIFSREEAYIDWVCFAVDRKPTLAEILHEFDWEAQRRPNKPKAKVAGS